MDREILEAFTEDTSGRRINIPTTTKKQMLRDSDKTKTEVKEYNIHKPMTFKAFKELPTDLQKEYLRWLITEFKVTYKAIAEHMEVHYVTFSKYISRRGANQLQQKGFRTTKENLKRLAEFFGKEIEQTAADDKKEPLAVFAEKEPVTETIPDTGDVGKVFDLAEFNLRFNGTLNDMGDALNKLKEILDSGCEYGITIAVSKNKIFDTYQMPF